MHDTDVSFIFTSRDGDGDGGGDGCGDGGGGHDDKADVEELRSGDLKDIIRRMTKVQQNIARVRNCPDMNIEDFPKFSQIIAP